MKRRIAKKIYQQIYILKKRGCNYSVNQVDNAIVYAERDECYFANKWVFDNKAFISTIYTLLGEHITISHE